MRGRDSQAEVEITLEEAFHGGPMQISVNGQALRLTLKPGLRDNQILRLKGKEVKALMEGRTAIC